MTDRIPVVLFAYNRPEHLERTLACLRENSVPLIYAFSDGPRTPDAEPAVVRVREILRKIDWCELELCERGINLGLGRSVLAGVSQVLEKHEAAIVFEDDLICVPGTYEYLSAALRCYASDSRVMSVTGWTHSKITPTDVSVDPYFDGRAECWVWGSWARAWKGMEEDAQSLVNKCEGMNIDTYKYGADLVGMAQSELKKNIWAVRFLYWHIVNRGLCLRPPHSMVEHIGFGSGTNFTATELPWFANPPLRACPVIPTEWPEPSENAQCSSLHQAVCGERPMPRTVLSRIVSRMRRYAGRCVGLVRGRA
jgi:hypothetical protein